MDAGVDESFKLIKALLPDGVELEIRVTDGSMIAKYLLSATYTSAKSGRKMSMHAKGDALPLLDSDYELLRFYGSQLCLSQREVGQAFSKLYWYEKRARQDAFLFGGGKARGNDVRVATEESMIDRIIAQEIN